MPKFFFHLYDDMVVRDQEGRELPNAASAREQAVAEARQLACAEVLEGHLSLSHRIEVEDESGGNVATVEFKDAVRLEG